MWMSSVFSFCNTFFIAIFYLLLAVTKWAYVQEASFQCQRVVKMLQFKWPILIETCWHISLNTFFCRNCFFILELMSSCLLLSKFYTCFDIQFEFSHCLIAGLARISIRLFAKINAFSFINSNSSNTNQLILIVNK